MLRDTRKTTPGLRQLEKYAVRCGGGVNHRMGLGDAALVKDNHVAAAGGITAAIRAVQAAAPGLPLEVECDSVAQVEEALAAGAELILLDNMSLASLRAAVAVARGYPAARLEASGGLRLGQASAVAATGVHYLSVGALTHSAPALDLGLDLRPAGRRAVRALARLRPGAGPGIGLDRHDDPADILTARKLWLPLTGSRKSGLHWPAGYPPLRGTQLASSAAAPPGLPGVHDISPGSERLGTLSG